MRIIYFLAAAMGLTVIARAGVIQDQSPQLRRCRSADGRLLYEVRGSRVTDPAGRLLGTAEHGTVKTPDGRIIAQDGDAGLLWCQAH